MTLKERASAALLTSLGKMAKAAADRRLDRSAATLGKIGPMVPSNPRRIALEDRAIRDLDESLKLQDASRQAFAAASLIRGGGL